jgi:peroxiredoxin
LKHKEKFMMDGKQVTGEGLSAASITLGVVAITLAVFVVGLLPALVGLGFGIACLLRSRLCRSMAWWGIVLSVIGLLLSGFVGWQYCMKVISIKDRAQSRSGSAFEKVIGTEAPELTVTTLDGETMSLSSLRGKRVVLDFWATWCPPCRKEIPHFIRLRSETSSDELIIIGLSSEDAETIQQFAAENGINYPLSAGRSDLPAPYSQVRSIPTTFFIDENGCITDVAVGYHDFESLRAKALGSESE